MLPILPHPFPPRRSADLGRGESCGVPGLVAVAQSSSGSVANVKDIAAGRIESGFVQSDVAFWAYSGLRAFAGEGRQTSLRAIANLYPEDRKSTRLNSSH